MAKKQVKSKPLLRSIDTDFTIKDLYKAIYRFNKENVVTLELKKSDLSVSIILADEKANKTYKLTGVLSELSEEV